MTVPKKSGEPTPTVVTREDDPLVEAMKNIATHLKYLGNGNAATQMGAIENHAVQVKEGSERIASSLDGIAEAINRLADAVCDRYYDGSVAQSIDNMSKSIDNMADALPHDE